MASRRELTFVASDTLRSRPPRLGCSLAVDEVDEVPAALKDPAHATEGANGARKSTNPAQLAPKRPRRVTQWAHITFHQSRMR